MCWRMDQSGLKQEIFPIIANCWYCLLAHSYSLLHCSMGAKKKHNGGCSVQPSNCSEIQAGKSCHGFNYAWIVHLYWLHIQFGSQSFTSGNFESLSTSLLHHDFSALVGYQWFVFCDFFQERFSTKRGCKHFLGKILKV